MRLWSLHPQYLDRLALLAVWRESLLALSILKQRKYKDCPNCKGAGQFPYYGEACSLCSRCKATGKIKTAYYDHPQLLRFKQQNDKINCIKSYLYELYKEARHRNYNFNFDKICKRSNANFFRTDMTVTDKQLEYEMKHLQKKLVKRDLGQFTANLYNVYDKNMNPKNLKANPIFKVIKGEIESWERIK